MSGLWLASYVALWILVILLVIVVLGLVRQLGLIHLRLGLDSHVLTTNEGLELNTAAPEFSGTDLTCGRELKLADLKGRPSVLIFASPSCGPCRALLAHLATFHRKWRRKVNIVLFSQSDSQIAIDLIHVYRLKLSTLADPDGVVAKTYRVHATPFAYRLDKNGIVQRRGIVNDLEGLEALLEDVVTPEPLVELPPVEPPQTNTVSKDFASGSLTSRR